LDRRIPRMGYASRSEFFTAVAYAALGETQTGKTLTGTAAEWLKENTPRLTEDQIRHTLLTLIGETLTPVIAIRGVDIAFPATWKDIRHTMHEKTGIWTTESELKEAYHAFAILNRQKLTAYKNKQLEGNQP
ncbi:MAG: hypothetical protein Q4Q04_04415, partial [Methanocorpusculum sp.]|nr:hypothetical protein [Methanocorpusculum sp.]